MSRSRIVRSAREVLLTAGAVLGVVCIVVTMAGFAFGIKPLMFRSGSMSPAIHTGDLAFSRTVEASQLHKGDIVSVIDSEGNRVTHRMVSAAEQGDARRLKLKGDANKAPDAEAYAVAEADRVMFNLPNAGYAVSAASSPGGVFVLGLYVALMLMLVFRRQPSSEGGGSAGGVSPPKSSGSRRAERPSRRGRARSAVVLAIAAGTATATIGASGPTSAAAWTNDVGVTGSVFTAYTVPKPAIVSCNVTGALQKTATIVWTEVSSPFALDYTAIIVETGQSMTVTDLGTTRRTQFSAGLLSTVLNQTYNIRITAKLPSPNGSWVSVNANQPVTIGLLGLSMSCGTAT